MSRSTTSHTTTTSSSSPLYTHTPHPHQPRNAAVRHREAQQGASFNRRLAIWITKHVGTMQCAYIFTGIGVGSLVGIATNNTILAAVTGSVSSYLLQLVLLPILAVGQEEGNKHSDLQSEEQFHATMRTLHESDQLAQHLSAQDDELLKQTGLLQQMVTHLGIVAPVSTSAPSSTSPLFTPTRTPTTKKGIRTRHGNQVHH